MIKNNIKISKKELINLIKTYYHVNGNVEFIFKKEKYVKNWYSGFKHNKNKKIFNGVVITTLTHN